MPSPRAAAAAAAAELRALLVADQTPPKDRVLALITDLSQQNSPSTPSLVASTPLARSPAVDQRAIHADPLNGLAALYSRSALELDDALPADEAKLDLLLRLGHAIADQSGIAPGPLRIFLRTLSALLNNALGQALLTVAGAPPKPRSAQPSATTGARSASSTHNSTRRGRAPAAHASPRKSTADVWAVSPSSPAATLAPPPPHAPSPRTSGAAGSSSSSSSSTIVAPALAQQQARRKAAYRRAQALLRFLVHCARDARPLSPPSPAMHAVRTSAQGIAAELLSAGRLPRATHVYLTGGGGREDKERAAEHVLVTGPLACPWDAVDPAANLRLPQYTPGAGVGFTVVLTFQLEDLLPRNPEHAYTEVVNLCQIDDTSHAHAPAGTGAAGPPLVGLALSVIRRPGDDAATVMQLHYTSTSFAFAQPSIRSGRMPPGASTTVVFGIGGGGGTDGPPGSSTPGASTRPLVLRPKRTYSLMLAHAAPPLSPRASVGSDSHGASAGAGARLPSLDMRTPVSLYIDGELVDVRRSVWPRGRPVGGSSGVNRAGAVQAVFGGTPAVSPLPPRAASQETSRPSPNAPSPLASPAALDQQAPSPQSALDPAASGSRSSPAGGARDDAATSTTSTATAPPPSEPTWALKLYTPLYLLRVHLPTSPLPSVGAGPDTAFLAHQLLLPSAYTAHGHTHEPSHNTSGRGDGAHGASGFGSPSRSHGSSTGLGRFLTYAGSMRVNLRLDERALPIALPASALGPGHRSAEEAQRHAEVMAEHALRERRRRLVRAVAGSGSDTSPASGGGLGGGGGGGGRSDAGSGPSGVMVAGVMVEASSPLGAAMSSSAASSATAGFPSPSLALALVAGKARGRAVSVSGRDRGPTGSGQVSSGAGSGTAVMWARDAMDFWGERNYGMYLSLDFGSPVLQDPHASAAQTSPEVRFLNRAQQVGSAHSAENYARILVRRPGGATESDRAECGSAWREYVALPDAAHVLGAVPAMLELLRLASWTESGAKDDTPHEHSGPDAKTHTSPKSASAVFVLLLELILLIIGGEQGWRTSEEAERTGAWEVLKLVLERNARLVMPAKTAAAEGTSDRIRGWAADERCSAAVLRVLFEAVGRRYTESGADLVLASSMIGPEGAGVKADNASWALVNPLLYRLILLDVRVFRFCRQAIRQEHLAHFDALLRESSFRSFNLRRVHRMGVLRRLLSAWNARVLESGPPEILPAVGVGMATPNGRAPAAAASLADDVLLAVRTLLKSQFSDGTVRILTSYLSTQVGRPQKESRRMPTTSLTPKLADSPASSTLSLATSLLVTVSELARERLPLLDKISAAADIRWLVPIFADWNASLKGSRADAHEGVDGRRIVSSSSMQSGLNLHAVSVNFSASDQLKNSASIDTSTLAQQASADERQEIVKVSLQLFVALCATDSRRQRHTNQDGQDVPSPSQRNYNDRFNGSGGFRVLERYLPLHWNAPATLPLCWAMLFGLAQVPAVSASGVVVATTAAQDERSHADNGPVTPSGFILPRMPSSSTRTSADPDAILLENFGPSRYVLVKNARALRLIVACWRQGVLDLAKKEDVKRKYSTLLPSKRDADGEGAASARRPQHLRKRSRSMNFDSREIVGDSDHRLLAATLSLLEQHCDREALRDDFRELLFTPNVLRGIVDAIVPLAQSIGAEHVSVMMPESAVKQAARMLALLARLATESMASTGSMAVVDALLGAVPPTDLTQQSAFRATLLDAVLRNVARASAVDLSTGKPVPAGKVAGVGALHAFVAFIARSSEEYMSGLTVSVPAMLKLLSGLFEQLREVERIASDLGSAIKKHARLRTMLLTSLNRIFLCQLATGSHPTHTLSEILEYQEWLLGPENSDDAFFECVLNRVYHQLRFSESEEDKQRAFEVLCCLTLARPPLAETALLPGKTAADVLQSRPSSVFDLLSLSLDGDESTELPYEDAWTAFVKSTEALRAAAHFERVAKVKQLMDRSDSRQRSVQNTEHKLRQWHQKLCENDAAKIARSEQDAREIMRYASKQQQEFYIDLQQQNSFLHQDQTSLPDMALDSTEGPRRMRKKLRPLRNISAEDEEATVAQGQHSRGPSGSAVEEANASPITPHLSLPVQDSVQFDSGDAQDEDAEDEDVDTPDVAPPEDDEDDDKFRRVLRALDRGDIIEDVFNASRVVSIECRGTLTIIGRSNLYLLDDYFQRPNGELVDAWEAPAEERDAFVLATLPTNVEQRSMLITQLDGEARTRKWSWHEVDACFRRTWLHRKTALELFFRDGQSCLLVLPSTELLNRIYAEVRARAPRAVRAAEAAMISICEPAQPSSGPSFFKAKLADAAANALRGRSQVSGALTQAWVERRVSNFEYLMSLNSLSGRTYNDCTQYPVMPWVLADYTSSDLDLNKTSTFRNLALPMGAQSATRRAEVEDRYQQLLEMAEDGDAAFHYGTHYSTAAVVCAYLVRVRPFDRVLVALQGGTFDLADRTFSSIPKAWASASEQSRGDVRELTPEFYYLPEMFVNTNHFDFGTTQAGQQIDDVELPPWAKGSPLTFIKLHREALESDYVSANLHLWIDLIFGWRSRGPGAVEATNCFHPLSYESGIDLETIESTLERQAAAQAIHNFGQTPQQLFSRPHPPRSTPMDSSHPLGFTLEDHPWLLIESFAALQELGTSIITIIDHDGSAQAFGRRSVAIGGNAAQVTLHEADNSVVISPTGTAASAGTLWLPTTVEQVTTSPITYLSAAGQSEFVTASLDGLLTVSSLDPRTGQVSIKGTLRGHSTPVKSVFVSSAWSIILTGSADGIVMLWDLNRLEHIRTLPPHSGHVDLVTVDEHHGFLSTISSTAAGAEVRLWTINGDLLAEHLIDSTGLGSVSAVAFLGADLHSGGRLAVLLTGHENKVASWECVPDPKFGTRGPGEVSPQNRWKLRQHYVFEHRDRLGDNRERITAILATNSRMLTGDARGRLFQWAMPGGHEANSTQLSTESLMGGCCAECDKRFGVLEARRTCSGCAGTFCSACAAVEGGGAFKGHRFCSHCKSTLQVLPLGL